LVTPEWVANTGLPLLVTLLGLLAAYTFLRRQLRSDRALRRADRRQEAALKLGAEIAEALARFQSDARDPFWQQMNWVDGRPLTQARAEALLSLDDTSLPELTSLIHDMECAWTACVVAARRQNPTPDLALHRHAVQGVTMPYREAMLSQSISMRMWDGIGTVPESVSPSSPVHAPDEDPREWMQSRKSEYEGTFSGKILLVKPIGTRLWDR
jgi:hypothetical protein